MIRCRVDSSGLKARLRAMAGASPAARRDAVIVMVDEVLRRVLNRAPRDTNRYVRAWAEAGNSAGTGAYFVPALQRAKLHERIMRRLANQVSFWEYVVRRYEGRNRHDRWYAQALRKLTSAREQLKRAADSPEEAVVAINLYGRSLSKGGFTQAIGKVYGGEGQIRTLGDRTYVVLHNMEAHASIVESRTHVMREAAAAFRGAGLKRGKAAFVGGVKRVADRAA